MLRTADKRLFIGERLDLVLRDQREPLVPVQGMSAHYKAHPSNFTITSNKVEQWNDLSGNGHHLTQATAGNRPLYDATPRTINGVICPEFIAAGTTFLESTCPVDDRTAWLAIVCVVDNLVDAKCILGDTQGGGWEIRVSGGLAGHLKSGVAFLSGSTQAWVTGRTTVYQSYMDASTHYHAFPGMVDTDADATTFTAGRTLRMGKDTSGTIFMDGLIGEYLVYPFTPTAAQRAHTFRYFAQEWFD